MPLIVQIMDNLSKGKPVSAVYLDLWCRTYDDSFVIANRSKEMVFFSGFNGERAERTWSSRIKILSDLGFIDIKDGPNGPISYVLIKNPFHTIVKLQREGRVSNQFFNGLKQRMIEIGARDLEEAEVAVSPAPVKSARPMGSSLRSAVRKPPLQPAPGAR